MFKLLDLFSGIGGFSLGLERTGGFETVAFCEIDKKARAVLNKHWPEVPIYEDVQTLTAERLGADGITVDAICGGFPCQDISLAGRGAGLEGERSGLWFQFHRLIKEIRPKVAIIENVSALRSRGLDEVLRSLAEIRYDAEWHCIPASAVGAPHRRDRIWIVAYPSSARRQEGNFCNTRDDGCTFSQRRSTFAPQPSETSSSVADSYCEGLEGQRPLTCGIKKELNNFSTACGWEIEPAVGRVADGVSGRVDRLKQLGNAVVPQIPELIGRAILASAHRL